MKYFLFFFFVVIGSCCFSQTKDPLEHAKELVDHERYEQALTEVTGLIKKSPAVADYYDFRAEVYMRMKMFGDAMSDYDKAISLEPRNSLFYLHRGILFYTTQNPDEAIRDNDTALKWVKVDSMVNLLLLNRGACYIMKREFQRAYEDFLQIVKTDSTDLGALNNLGAVLDELGRSDEAISYLQKVVKLYPKDAAGYINLAFQYSKKGEYRKALEWSDKVLEIDPESPQGYNNRGYVKYKLKDLQGAMKDVNRSLEIYPENSYAYRNRALIFIELKQMSKACEDLKKAISLGFIEMYGDEVQKLLDKYCAMSN